MQKNTSTLNLNRTLGNTLEPPQKLGVQILRQHAEGLCHLALEDHHGWRNHRKFMGKDWKTSENHI